VAPSEAKEEAEGQGVKVSSWTGVNYIGASLGDLNDTVDFA